MALILDGKKARDFYMTHLVHKVAALKARGIAPRLAIVQIGDNKESNIYIEQKVKFGRAIDVLVDHVCMPETSSQLEMKALIEKLNHDPAVHGIILQLPIPEHLDKIALINLIDAKKDVDGLTDENVRLLDLGTPHFIPATAKGVMTLLDFYKIDPKGKKAAVFGRSRLVGHPIAELLRLRGASVSVCHSKTVAPEDISKHADIVVVAIGRPHYIGARFIKEGAIVVDVGINAAAPAPGTAAHKLEEEIPRRKIVGDVDFMAVSPIVSAISPVPGGVGPMTVLSLFDNLISSVEVKS